jgi:hypothetical protein
MVWPISISLSAAVPHLRKRRRHDRRTVADAKDKYGDAVPRLSRPMVEWASCRLIRSAEAMRVSPKGFSGIDLLA